jgi:hypothetical protein
MPNEIRSYSELQQQVHEDLRIQHPDWVEPNGDCPTCDSYEARLAELLGLTQRSKVMQPAPLLGHADDY